MGSSKRPRSPLPTPTEQIHKRRQNVGINTSETQDNQVEKLLYEVEHSPVITDVQELDCATPGMNLPDSGKMRRKKKKSAGKTASNPPLVICLEASSVEKVCKRKQAMNTNTVQIPDNLQGEKLQFEVDHGHVLAAAEEVKCAEPSMKLPDSEEVDRKKKKAKRKRRRKRKTSSPHLITVVESSSLAQTHKQKQDMEINSSENPDSHQVEKLQSVVEHGPVVTDEQEAACGNHNMNLSDSEKMVRKKTSNLLPVICMESSSIGKIRKRKKTLEINMTGTPDICQLENLQPEADHNHFVTDTKEVKCVEPSMILPASEKMYRKKKKTSSLLPVTCIESSSIGKSAEVISDKISTPNNLQVDNLLSEVENDIIVNDTEAVKCVEPSQDFPDSKEGKSSKKRKKKQRTSCPSDITCTESSFIGKSTEKNVLLPNANLEITDGLCIEIASETSKGVKSRHSRDSQNEIDTGVSSMNGHPVKMNLISDNSSGMKPMISDVYSCEVDGRYSEQTRKKKRCRRDSEIDSGDGLPSHFRAIHNDSRDVKSTEPETFPRMQEVERTYSRRRKGKNDSMDYENNLSGFTKPQVESSNNDCLQDNSEPIVPEKPKVKFKYSKRERRQKHEDQEHEGSKARLEAESSQALLEGINSEAVSTSESKRICSQVSYQQTGKEDQSSDGIKAEESREKAFLVVSSSESQLYPNKVGELGSIVNEDIIGKKSFSGDDDAQKHGLQRSLTFVTVDLASVEGMVAQNSCMDYCNSLNDSIKENIAALEKLRKQDDVAREEILQVEKPLFPARKKLLVLDLNGLLVDILFVSNITDREYKRISGKSAFKRPFCDQFLDFCLETFDIGVWSSRMRYNVDAVVNYVMGDKKKKLLFSWDQSKCTKTNYKTIENCHKPLVLKELTKLWDKEEHLPWEKGEYTPSNTLLIDDSPYKALCNPPYTAIFPPPYRYDNELDDSLGLGGDIRTYLEGLAAAWDVQEYVKEHPFGQPSISEDHPSWEFYLKIIEEVKSVPHTTQN